ncbi:MAG: trigger factor [Planctomycetaceae bacterium]
MADDINEAQAGTLAVAESSDTKADRLDLKVGMRDIGPCKKHISVQISGQDIDALRNLTISEFSKETTVPGFRMGKVPDRLLAKRFKKEIAAQLKQKLLLQSLEQITEENKLEPINEPELDVENLEVPDTGDFEYEFEVEVRPQFEVPDYTGMTIVRPIREISEEDVISARNRHLSQFGQIAPHEGPAEAGDYLVCNLAFTHQGQPLREMEEVTLRICPTLRFRDAEITGFDTLVIGAQAGDVREFDVTISREASDVEMRDETVHAKLDVLDVKRLELPQLDESLLTRFSCESPEQFDQRIRESLERQVAYEQRQRTREQVLQKITESATWELPEGLVSKHVENAVRREMLEMQQAGFSREQILARETLIRQQGISTTQQALKEHFVLDRIAEQEGIVCNSDDIATEIYYMAMQRGESPRKLRARLAKSGMIDNLEAQIRERKAVDFILGKAQFEDVVQEDFFQDTVEAVNRSITSTIQDTEYETGTTDADLED